MLLLVFGLLVVIMISEISFLTMNQDRYIDSCHKPIRRMDTAENNVTTYIQQSLHEVQNSSEREKKIMYFREYTKDRDKIIKMLPRLTKQSFHTNFHVLVDKTSKLIGQKYDMVILVLSYSFNFERRRTIRKLWGNKTLSVNKRWSVVFVTGGVNDGNAMKKLYQEAMRERDVIIVDFMENYDNNLPKKDMTAIQWANTNFIYDYIMKCDDDLFIDIDSLISRFRKKANKLIYAGSLMVGSEVFRSGRYAIPVEDYPAKVYEPYCSGGAFVMSRRLVERVIPHFQWEFPLRIEDAYWGGRVAKAGGKAMREKGFYMWNTKCEYDEYLLATHPANKKCMEKLQEIIL